METNQEPQKRKNAKPVEVTQDPSPTNQVTQIPDTSLQEVIQESQQKILEAAEEAPKRRGRKPGGKNRTKVMESPQAQIDKKQLTEVLKTVVATPYTLLAQRTGIQALACTEEEVQVQAAAITEVLALVAPAMDPKSAAIVGACVAVGGVALSKYAIYHEAKEAAFKHGPSVVA